MSLTGVTPDGKKRQVDLGYAVKHWPTPSVNDSKNDGACSQSKRHTPGLNTIVKNGSAGQLNADWVEILMGYDIGWTNIDCEHPVHFPGWPGGQGEYQYDYEPSRVIAGQKNRAKRLKCLGNSVVQLQPYPIFAAIMEVENAPKNQIP